MAENKCNGCKSGYLKWNGFHFSPIDLRKLSYMACQKTSSSYAGTWCTSCDAIMGPLDPCAPWHSHEPIKKKNPRSSLPNRIHSALRKQYGYGGLANIFFVRPVEDMSEAQKADLANSLEYLAKQIRSGRRYGMTVTIVGTPHTDGEGM